MIIPVGLLVLLGRLQCGKSIMSLIVIRINRNRFECLTVTRGRDYIMWFRTNKEAILFVLALIVLAIVINGPCVYLMISRVE